MKYTIEVAQSIRAYGYVVVEAETIEEAVDKIDYTFVFENFSPHGGGSNDFDYSDPKDVWLGAWEDEEGGDGDVELDLSEDLEPVIDQAWLFVTNFEQINRRDVDVLWDGDEPVAYRVNPIEP